MENRIKRFQDLHNNKWFNIMNWCLDELKAINMKKKRYMLVKYGGCFYF